MRKSLVHNQKNPSSEIRNPKLEKSAIRNPQSAIVLVTGGAGFIGSNFIRYVLKKYPADIVINLDKLTYAGNLENLEGIKDNPGYRFVRGDIADRELVNRLFAEERFDLAVNFAAESHVDRSILDAAPFIEANIKGAQVLLEVARYYGVKKFLQVSTDEVYGSLGKEGLFREDSPIRPNSPYAASKAAADLLCYTYYNTYDLPVIITRSSNNYGPYQFPEKLMPLMIRNALNDKKLPIYGQGGNVRDWIYVEDNCRAIDLVLRNGRVGEVYNIGASCERVNLEIVKLILKKLDKPESLIEFIEDPRGKAHDFRYGLDSSKVQNELNWSPRYDLEEGLDKTIEWYLAHQGWLERVITGEYLDYYRKVYGSNYSITP
ncbi:MAG: dTDP-glucose 4,6-dehydratase [bacterium]|nr:dTDP-glucose 4,6-dehydratase [bacterium]